LRRERRGPRSGGSRLGRWRCSAGEGEHNHVAVWTSQADSEQRSESGGDAALNTGAVLCWQSVLSLRSGDEHRGMRGSRMYEGGGWLGSAQSVSQSLSLSVSQSQLLELRRTTEQHLRTPHSFHSNRVVAVTRTQACHTRRWMAGDFATHATTHSADSQLPISSLQ
jgi:hypothetical protein